LTIGDVIKLTLCVSVPQPFFITNHNDTLPKVPIM
jgi:hypothetical protein